MIYKLNDAETVSVTLYHVPKTVKLGGKDIVDHKHYLKLAPKQEYETDDPAMLKFLQEYRRKVSWSTSLEKTLKSHNVPYTVELCKSCGGKKRFIFYQLVEVYDE